MKDYYTAARTIYQSRMLKERMALEGSTGAKTASAFVRTCVRQKLPVKKAEGFQLTKILRPTTERFQEDPVRLIRIFRLAQQFGAKLVGSALLNHAFDSADRPLDHQCLSG